MTQNSAQQNDAIRLKHPIKWKKEDGSQELVTTLQLQRLKAKHLKKLPKELFFEAKTEQEKREKAQLLVMNIGSILSALTGLPEEVTEEVDLEDMTAATDAIANFLERALG